MLESRFELDTRERRAQRLRAGIVPQIVAYNAFLIADWFLIPDRFWLAVALHALPQSEGFYRDDCGMQCCGNDPSYENLPYYEMTREIAARFTSSSSGGAA